MIKDKEKLLRSLIIGNSFFDGILIYTLITNFKIYLLVIFIIIEIGFIYKLQQLKKELGVKNI